MESFLKFEEKIFCIESKFIYDVIPAGVMRSLIYRRLSTLTKDRYPHVKRGSFSALQDKDVQYFEGLLNKNQIITDAEEVLSYNSDWLKSVCGKPLIYFQKSKQPLQLAFSF